MQDEIYLQGIGAAGAGQKAEAARLFSRVVIREPKNVEAWLRLEECLDDSQRKRDCLMRVLKLEPNNPVASVRLAELSAEKIENRIMGEPEKPITTNVDLKSHPQPKSDVGHAMPFPSEMAPVSSSQGAYGGIVKCFLTFFSILFVITFGIGIVLFFLLASGATDLSLFNRICTAIACFFIPAFMRGGQYSRYQAMIGAVLAILVSVVGGSFLAPFTHDQAGPELYVLLFFFSVDAALMGVLVFIKKKPRINSTYLS